MSNFLLQYQGPTVTLAKQTPELTERTIDIIKAVRNENELRRIAEDSITLVEEEQLDVDTAIKLAYGPYFGGYKRAFSNINITNRQFDKSLREVLKAIQENKMSSTDIKRLWKID